MRIVESKTKQAIATTREPRDSHFTMNGQFLWIFPQGKMNEALITAYEIQLLNHYTSQRPNP